MSEEDFVSVYFWHSKGWTSRNEALLEAFLKRARTTKHPWLIACDVREKPLVSERSSARDSTRRSVTVWIEKKPKEDGWRRYMIMHSLQKLERENFRHEGDRRF